MERVRTGIPGFDELIHGGIPKRNVVLLSGGPGTGKTIFAQQFLWNGLLMGEGGVLVVLEEHPVQVRLGMKLFGWDVSKYEQMGKFAIVDAFTAGIGAAAKRERFLVKKPGDLDELIKVLKRAMDEVEAERCAIDSVSTLYALKPSVARYTLLKLKKVLSGLGVTSILVSQVSVTERGFGGPGVEHAADGIIRLDLDEIRGELKRSLIIWKMRHTAHSMKRHPFIITDEGIKVLHEGSE